MIKRYEDSQQEIEKLKKEIDSLSDELNDTHQMYMNTPVPDPEAVVRVLPVLETYYKASTSSHIIDKESYASYKKALAERNIYVLTAASNTSYSKYLYIYIQFRLMQSLGFVTLILNVVLNLVGMVHMS